MHFPAGCGQHKGPDGVCPGPESEFGFQHAAHAQKWAYILLRFHAGDDIPPNETENVQVVLFE